MGWRIQASSRSSGYGGNSSGLRGVSEGALGVSEGALGVSEGASAGFGDFSTGDVFSLDLEGFRVRSEDLPGLVRPDGVSLEFLGASLESLGASLESLGRGLAPASSDGSAPRVRGRRKADSVFDGVHSTGDGFSSGDVFADVFADSSGDVFPAVFADSSVARAFRRSLRICVRM